MAGKVTEWPSKRGPIVKIMLLDGSKGGTAPLALGLWYDFHEVGCHLGNVGSLVHARVRRSVCADSGPGKHRRHSLTAISCGCGGL